MALHVYPAMHGAFPDAPKCFKSAKEWGHLMHKDADLLERTARALGVKRVVISERGTPYQHVDLCHKPLEKAKALCIPEYGPLPINGVDCERP